MTRAKVIRFGVAIVLLGLLGAAPEQAADKAQEQNKADLQTRLEAAEKRNTELFKKNLALQAQVKQLETQLAALRVVPAPAPDSKVPGNWKAFQFNGTTYYVVPLEGGQDAQRAKLIAK